MQVDRALDAFARFLSPMPQFVGILNYWDKTEREIERFDFHWPNSAATPLAGTTSKKFFKKVRGMANIFDIGSVEYVTIVGQVGIVIIVQVVQWILIIHYSNINITSLDEAIGDIRQYHNIVLEALVSSEN